MSHQMNGHMHRHIKPFPLLCMLLCATSYADEFTLMASPKVTATTRNAVEGGVQVQYAIHNGPLAQVVNSQLTGVPEAQLPNALAHQVKWRAPYLIVHASCNVNSVRRCEGDVVFKTTGKHVVRLGDFVETGTPLLTKSRFYDGYDKLGEQVEFTIVMNDVNDALEVDADATWLKNADTWLTRSKFIDGAFPSHDWSNEQWTRYFNTILNNAVLARYCNHGDELQALLDHVNTKLDADYRRQLTDALSKVVPAEIPKVWRPTF